MEQHPDTPQPPQPREADLLRELAELAVGEAPATRDDDVEEQPSGR